MSQLPPKFDPPEDIDDRYRRWSALDRSRPSEGVRDAVLAHARRVAEANAAGGSQEQRGAADAAAADRAGGRRRRLWRGPAVFGTLAAAALVGLLIVPRVVMTPEASRSEKLIAPRVPKPSHSFARAAAPQATAPSEPTQEVASIAAPPAVALPKLAAASPADATPAPPRDMSGTLQEVVVTGARREPNYMASSPAPIASSERGTPAPAVAPVIQLPPDEAMLHAVVTGDLRALKKSIKDRADVNSRDGAGRTALLLATQKGDAKAVKLLLARGANPDLADSTGVTPLQAATTAKQNAIRKLLEHGGAHP
jgi:hypothetical protein